MKAAFLALSALVPAVALKAQSLAPTPYVETTTLTFFWAFTDSYVSNVYSGVPALPGVGTFDPNTLPSGVESWTDTIRHQAYTGPVSGFFPPAGANQQIIELLLQRLVRSGQLNKNALTYRWQIIAVREAPANVAELASNPYRIFLATQRSTAYSATPFEVAPFGDEGVVDDPLPTGLSFLDTTPDFATAGTPVVTVNTGLTLTLGGYSGNYTETNWGVGNNKVRNASGNVAAAFTIDFGAVFYEDPKHAVDTPTDSPTFNYHLKRNYWWASASGLINYGIRSSPPPFPTFVASSSSATGTGWFFHQRDEVEYKNNVPVPVDDETKTFAFAGIAPLRVTMSTIQYQKRDRFPSLGLPNAPQSVTATAGTRLGAPIVTVAWIHPDFRETHLLLEREADGSGVWDEIPRLEANTLRYVDTNVESGKSYAYRIRAAHGGGESAYSDIATVAVP